MRTFLIICIILGILIPVCVIYVDQKSIVVIPDVVEAISPLPTPTPTYTVKDYGLEHRTLEYWDTEHNNIELTNNPDAIDVSWDELVDFLIWDNSSDEREGWTCGQHSEFTHNLAESVGIRAYFVIIEFSYNATTDTRHYLLAFDTTDRGRVFIECYGGDGICQVEEGEPYIVTDITNENYSYQWGNKPVKKIIIIGSNTIGPTPAPAPTPTPTPTPVCPRPEYEGNAWACSTTNILKPDGSYIIQCRYGVALPLQNRAEVEQFMRWDSTDTHPNYNCANFVNDICDIASRHEIQAYPVVLWFKDNTVHAIILFPTEEGDVFIDATQSDWWAYPVVGELYNPVNFYNPSRSYCTTPKVLDRMVIYY